MAKRGSRFPIAEVRELLAQEAARLIIEHGMQDYGQAKRKAAQRLGVTDAGALPANTLIEAKLAERQRIFEPDSHPDRVSALRRLAAELMALLAPYEPRLVGPVLAGTATINSAIELHVFTDAPEDIAAVLELHGISSRACQRRYRVNGKQVSTVPGFKFASRGEQIYAMAFPEKGLRQAPLSPIDRRPMRRAARTEVLSLLEDA